MVEKGIYALLFFDDMFFFWRDALGLDAVSASFDGRIALPVAL